MKIVKCRDMGFNCDHIETGKRDDIDIIKERMIEHITTVHMKDEPFSDEDVNDMRNHIHTLLSRSCGCGAL